MLVKKKKHRSVLYKKAISNLPDDSFKSQKVSYFFLSNKNIIIDKNQIEAARIIIARELRKLKLKSRKNKLLLVNVTFQLPYTKKSTHSRMGKGKGNVNRKLCYLSVYQKIFTLRNVTESLALRLFFSIYRKLSFPISLYCKEGNKLVCVKSKV